MASQLDDSPVYANYEDMRNSGPTSSTDYMVHMGPSGDTVRVPVNSMPPKTTQQYRGFKTCKY